MWSSIPKSAPKKAKQQWDLEKTQKTTCTLNEENSRYFPDEVEESDAITQNARRKLEVPMEPATCVTRIRIPNAKTPTQKGTRSLRTSFEPCLSELLVIVGMRRVRCDQCQFGMTSVDGVENVEPARKATGFMTNDAYIAEAVNRRCFWWTRSHSTVERQSESL